MFQLNYNGKCYTSAKAVKGKGQKQFFKKEAVKKLVDRIHLMPYGKEREETVMTLECLLSGKKIEMDNGKIYLYFERRGVVKMEPSYDPIENKELYTLLKDLVQS